MLNPFVHGKAVPPERFVGRQRELRRVLGRVASEGQSSVVVGEPRTGKSSLLLYLQAPAAREILARHGGPRSLVRYLDAQTLQADEGPPRFWARALEPVERHLAAPVAGGELAKAWSSARDADFRGHDLEVLLGALHRAGLRLVLLLDELDALLHHPVLNQPGFFGALRGLAQRPDLGLCVVAASRLTTAALNRETAPMSRHGSPYFNINEDVVLGPLAPREVQEVLAPGAARFSGADLSFLARAAGGHPFLLQAGAAELWEAHEEGVDTHAARCARVAAGLRKASGRALGDTWELWSPAQRVAFCAVAILQMNELGRAGPRFDTEAVLRDLPLYTPEIDELTERGFLRPDADRPGGHVVAPEALSWWLADELVRSVRDAPALDAWLDRHQMSGVLSGQERSALSRALSGTLAVLQSGAKVLVESAARAAAEGTVKGLLA